MSPEHTHDLRARIEELEIELDQLRARVADLEGNADPGDDTLPEGVTDRYDAHIIQDLERGDSVTLSYLQSKYREAGIRSDTTLKQRIKQITKMDYFETAGVQQWTFVGREGEKENGGGE